jgi:hypothetical protein
VGTFCERGEETETVDVIFCNELHQGDVMWGGGAGRTLLLTILKKKIF